MAEPLSMAAYHDAVIGTLKALPWVADADTYPENTTQLVTPAVYLSVDGWDPKSNIGGQPSVSLSVSLYIVVDRASATITKPDIYIRTAAADLTQWIDGQQFGLPYIDGAVFVSAEPDAFDPAMDDYLVWRITYEQGAAFGADPFARGGVPVKGVWLGKVPEVGAAHVADYRKIYEAPNE
ncbi:hypothetical protein SJZ81_10790 [Hafnia alvei]|uniref:hypothetical protein n=1 Tax=Hafnia TaxID=568 RepID=UPI0029D8427D|nr:hypothetical protein [Hafnia alvei]MDX6845489.1 hypothetical protein [Hafnia alvei]